MLKNTEMDHMAKQQVPTLSRLAKSKTPKIGVMPRPKDNSKISKVLPKAKEPTKAVSPKFHLPKRLSERRKRLEILEEERKKQENKKIKESESEF